MFTWNKAKFEFSFFDVKTMDSFIKEYETCMHGIAEASDEDGVIRGSKNLKAACQSVRNFFDRIFGAGSANKMFGNRYDYLECQKALLKIANTVKAQQEEQASVAASLASAFQSKEEVEEE